MKVLSPAQAAERLGLNAEYVRRLLRAGRFPGHRVNGKWKITSLEVEKYRSGMWDLERAQSFLDTVPVPETKDDPVFGKTIRAVRSEYDPSPADLAWLIRNWSRLLFSDDELKKH